MVLAHAKKPQAGGSAWHQEQRQLDGSCREGGALCLGTPRRSRSHVPARTSVRLNEHHFGGRFGLLGSFPGVLS